MEIHNTGFCGLSVVSEETIIFFPILLFLSLEMKNFFDGYICIVQAAYNIGGHVISANAIEHAIFCFRTPRSGRVLILISFKNTQRYICTKGGKCRWT